MNNQWLRRAINVVSIRALSIALIVFVLLAVGSAYAETAKQDFEENCAGCHGFKGDGHGTDPALMRNVPMPNLTLLSQQNGGQFPFQDVVDAIDGRGRTPLHGWLEMPFWGLDWQTPGAHFSPESDAAVKQRIDALARYIETLQRK